MSAPVSNSRVVISVFEPIYAPVPASAPPARSQLIHWVRLPRRDGRGSAVCVVVILAAHLAILAPYLGGPANRTKVAATSDLAASSNDTSMQAFFMESMADTRYSSPYVIADPPPLDVTPLLTMDVPKDVLLEADMPAASTNTQSGVNGDSMMAGRYVKQIDHRIERAWLRPRTPLKSDYFECRVQVEQDSGGNVLAIELGQCNGDSQWQQSLVHAIQAASPLPAPPDPSVFRRRLRLSFTAHSYSQQSPSDGYEP
jgi:TonB C terminal